MFKNWISKMEWNDKACLIGLILFVAVCEYEHICLRKKGLKLRMAETEPTDSE